MLSSPSSVKSEDVASVPSHPLHRELCLILKEIKVVMMMMMMMMMMMIDAGNHGQDQG